jgi:exodeoxyribonuclease V alpha subunit
VNDVGDAEAEPTAMFGQIEATFDFGELDALQLAYPTTIHKSQGSEYLVVVLPLTMQAYTMLGRELIYTAVMRARNLLVILGSRKALSIAVRRRQPRRWSLLRNGFAGSASSAGSTPHENGAWHLRR